MSNITGFEEKQPEIQVYTNDRFMKDSKLSYFIVDVFGISRYTGNQLAVFENCDSLKSEEMQKIARELNFSETTFILRKNSEKNEYSVRIFTPLAELEFAGHPVLGTAWVIKNLIEKSNQPVINLNLKVGKISVKFNQNTGEEIGWMKQPPPRFGEIYPRGSVAEIVNLPEYLIEDRYPVQEVSTGLPVIVIPLNNLSALEEASVDTEKYFRFIRNKWAQTIYLFSIGSFSGKEEFSVRFFPINLGIHEDPATGSAAGCLTAYLLKYNCLNSNVIDLKIEQGVQLRRNSNLFIKGSLKDDYYQIEVGGKVFPVAHGIWQ